MCTGEIYPDNSSKINRGGVFKKPNHSDLNCRSRYLLLLIVVLSFSLSAWAQKTLRIELTPEEQAWLKAHPEIVLGAPTDYPPMVIKNADGTHVGALVDLFEQVSQHLNTRIRLHIEDSWADIQEKAQNREIDGLALGGQDPSRAAIYNATDALFTTYFSVFGRSRADNQITSFSDLEGMRIGYKGAARPTRTLLEKLPFATLKPYDSHESMTQALLSKEIDVIVAWMSYDHWRKEKLQGTIDNVLLIDEYPIEMVTHVRKDWPELIPILNKVIAVLQQDQVPRINNKWFGQWPRQSKTSSVPLTEEEQAWLAENHTIRVRFWQHPPFFYIKDGKIVGIAVDLLNRITEITGITFQYENRLDRFSDVLQGLKEHRGSDLVGALMPTTERKNSILFTEPYFNSPRFIFTRDDAPFVSSIENLFDKNIAVVEGYVIHTTLVEGYPNIDLLICENNEEALRAVSMGLAFAFIGDLVATPAMINEFGLKNLKAACPSGLSDHPLAIATRDDWPELRDILDKALVAIPADEKAAIMNKWSTVRIEHGIRGIDVLKWLLGISAVALCIVLLLFLWNRTLNRIVQERTSKLAQSEERFRATFEQAAVGIAHVSLEGRFLRINQKFCEIAGYSLQEILQCTFKDITYPDDLDTDIQNVNQLLSGKSNTYAIEKRYIRKNGELVWVHLTVSLVRDDAGRPQWFVGVIKDISERKQAEEEIRRLRDEQAHMARVTAMGELTASLAHELKQPLAAIRTNAQAAQRFLSMSEPDIDELHEVLKDIIQDNRRADDVIGKLRAFMQKRELQATALDIDNVILETLTLIKSYEEMNNISLQSDLDDNIRQVEGDRVQLQQVVLNLILNSTEALSLSTLDTPSILVRTLNHDEEYVTVSVIDNGPGINEEIIEKIFDAFYTTKQEGLGMGLAICRSIVEQHRGRLWAENNPNGGAVFSFTIPLHKENSA